MKLITYPARPRNGGPTPREPARGRWFVSPKYNEWRCVAHTPTRTLWNRKGERSSLDVPALWQHVSELGERGLQCCVDWLDIGVFGKRVKELPMKGAVVVFDIIPSTHADNVLTYEKRREIRNRAFPELMMEHIPAPYQVFSPEECMIGNPEHEQFPGHGRVNTFPGRLDSFIRGLKLIPHTHDLFEGVVLKRADSLYPMQSHNPDIECGDWIKHRWD